MTRPVVVNGDPDCVVSEGRSKVLGLLANAVFRNYVSCILVRLWGGGGGRQTNPLPWAPKDLATALTAIGMMH